MTDDASPALRPPASVPDLRLWLEWRFPGFEDALRDSLFRRDDGSFTAHGLCAAFSRYYVERAEGIDAARLGELFAMVEALVAADPQGFHALSSAVTTCFLENIAGTDGGRIGRDHMGPLSRAFFDPWNRQPGDRQPGDRRPGRTRGE